MGLDRAPSGHFDQLCRGRSQSRAQLDEKISELLDDQQQRLQVACTHHGLPGQFGQLIRGACEKTGQRAVVLVDEYDKPILDNLTDSRK